MSDARSNFIFNLIAPIYGLFFNSQRRKFKEIIALAEDKIDLSDYQTVLDVGSGTGALCSVLAERGLEVTGVEVAAKMLEIAKRKTGDLSICFMQADVLAGLPFTDKSFDLSFSSYVAHGMSQEDRLKMYAEMARLSKYKVIIHDYNDKRSLITSFVEKMEGPNYPQFIANAEIEMRECHTELRDCFSKVEILQVGKRANWYICTPR